MTPLPFGTFPKNHPIWYIYPSLRQISGSDFLSRRAPRLLANWLGREFHKSNYLFLRDILPKPKSILLTAKRRCLARCWPTGEKKVPNIWANSFPMTKHKNIGGSSAKWRCLAGCWPAGEKLRRVFPTTGEVTKLCHNKYFQQIAPLFFPLLSGWWCCSAR